MGQTVVHPIALTLTLAMGVAMLVVRREWAVLPVLLVACLVTHAQRIVVGGLDFSMLRIVILFGWVRILSRGETQSYRPHLLDYVLPVWLAFGTLAYVIGPRASMDRFVWRLGFSLDAAGGYFLFRVLLRDVRSVRQAVAVFGWIALLLVGPMIAENLTGRNLFAALGGVPENTLVRDGRMRCRAAFSHPIMAGNFGASTAAMLFALWLAYPKKRLQHTAGLVAAGAMTILSSSGGPAMVLMTAILGWMVWPLRRFMRLFRWGMFTGLVVIHFVREKPVWHLIGRLGSISGGDSWHRYQVINSFIRHFDEWWLLGTDSTRHWSISGSSRDLTNQYVIEGVRGGLPTLLAFIAILVIAFRTVGQSLRRAAARKDWTAGERRRAALLVWGLGVCLTAHSVGFIGVSYFGQLQSIFFIQLAMIPSLAQGLSRKKRLPADQPSADRPSSPSPRRSNLLSSRPASRQTGETVSAASSHAPVHQGSGGLRDRRGGGEGR